MGRQILVFLLLFILSAKAQYPGRSPYGHGILWKNLHKSTQDTIRSIAGDSSNINLTDSLNALSGFNGIIYTERKFGLKILKDTTTAKAYKPDSVNTMALLGGLSASNTLGGGLIVYKSSGSTDYVTKFAVTGGGIWERVRQDNRVNVQWAGAVGDGSTDDGTAIRKAEAIVETEWGTLYLPYTSSGYNTSVPIEIDAGSITIESDNKYAAMIRMTADTAAIIISGGWNHVIQNIRIMGPGKSNTSSVGIWQKTLTNDPALSISNVRIDSCYNGILAYESNSTYYELNHIRQCNTGIRFQYQPDGVTLVNNATLYSDTGIVIGDRDTGHPSNPSSDAITIQGNIFGYDSVGVVLRGDGANFSMNGCYWEGVRYLGIIGVSSYSVGSVVDIANNKFQSQSVTTKGFQFDGPNRVTFRNNYGSLTVLEQKLIKMSSASGLFWGFGNRITGDSIYFEPYKTLQYMAINNNTITTDVNQRTFVNGGNTATGAAYKQTNIFTFTDKVFEQWQHTGSDPATLHSQVYLSDNNTYAEIGMNRGYINLGHGTKTEVLDFATADTVGYLYFQWGNGSIDHLWLHYRNTKVANFQWYDLLNGINYGEGSPYGSNFFTTTALHDTVLCAGVTSSNTLAFAIANTASPDTSCIISTTVANDTLFFHRQSGTISNLNYYWWRQPRLNY